MVYKKRHALTLIEIMLVIVLIGIVGGALAFNLRGALDRGKSFKTQQVQKKIEAILSIEAVEEDYGSILEHWESIVKKSPLVKLKQKKGEIVDAWGNPFQVEYDDLQGQFLVSSAKIDSDGNILD